MLLFGIVDLPMVRVLQWQMIYRMATKRKAVDFEAVSGKKEKEEDFFESHFNYKLDSVVAKALLEPHFGPEPSSSLLVEVSRLVFLDHFLQLLDKSSKD